MEKFVILVAPKKKKALVWVKGYDPCTIASFTTDLEKARLYETFEAGLADREPGEIVVPYETAVLLAAK